MGVTLVRLSEWLCDLMNGSLPLRIQRSFALPLKRAKLGMRPCLRI